MEDRWAECPQGKRLEKRLAPTRRKRRDADARTIVNMPRAVRDDG